MKKTGIQTSEGFGERIRKIRKAQRLSQKEFAEVMGYSASYISVIESGHKRPNVAFIEKLLLIYKINLNYLITGRGEKYLPDDEMPVKERQEKASIIKTIPDLMYYLKRSQLFEYAVMSFAIKYHQENAKIIEKTMEEAE